MGIEEKTSWEKVKEALERKTSKGFDEKALAATLKTRIFGQNRVIDQVATQIKLCMGRLQGSTGRVQRPLGVFLVAGPPCTGKSLLAKALTEALYGGKGQLQTYAMDQYAQSQSRSDLFGAPEGTTGGRGRLTSALQQKPRTIFELEGIEKAFGDTLKTIVTGWKEGHFTDGRTGDRVTNNEAIFFMTTNMAAHDLARADEDNENKSRRKEAITEALQRAAFTGEFIDQIDYTFAFQPLDNSSLGRLAAAEIKKTVAIYGLNVAKIDTRYLIALVSEEESRSGGLRNIGRRVEFELGDQFMALREKGVKTIFIGQVDGQPVASESNAPPPAAT